MSLGPVVIANSRYAARSAFAVNPLLIAPDQLPGRGWLAPSDLGSPDFPPHKTGYEAAELLKLAALDRAFERFSASSSSDRDQFDAFCERHRTWLDDYALFMAIKEVRGGRAWFDWEPGLALREPAALAEARRGLV